MLLERFEKSSIGGVQGLLWDVIGLLGSTGPIGCCTLTRNRSN